MKVWTILLAAYVMALSYHAPKSTVTHTSKLYTPVLELQDTGCLSFDFVLAGDVELSVWASGQQQRSLFHWGTLNQTKWNHVRWQWYNTLRPWQRADILETIFSVSFYCENISIARFNFTGIYSHEPDGQYSIAHLGNGLAPHSTIVSTHDEPFHWHIYASPNISLLGHHSRNSTGGWSLHSRKMETSDVLQLYSPYHSFSIDNHRNLCLPDIKVLFRWKKVSQRYIKQVQIEKKGKK